MLNGGHHRRTELFEDPPLAKLVFGSALFAWVWLPLRLFLGWDWFSHGLEKLSNPHWVVTGEALKRYWENAVRIPPPPARPPIVYDWYRNFINMMLGGEHFTWFAKLVVYAELLIGVALILGALTGIAAFFGGFMNWNFVMAGSASSNGMLFAIATWLVLAWKNAGYVGLDRWLLPALGTPWRPGRLFRAQVGERDPVASPAGH